MDSAAALPIIAISCLRALDFRNTWAGWDGHRAVEYLADYEHLALWAGCVGVLRPDHVTALRQRARRNAQALHLHRADDTIGQGLTVTEARQSEARQSRNPRNRKWRSGLSPAVVSSPADGLSDRSIRVGTATRRGFCDDRRRDGDHFIAPLGGAQPSNPADLGDR